MWLVLSGPSDFVQTSSTLIGRHQNSVLQMKQKISGDLCAQRLCYGIQGPPEFHAGDKKRHHWLGGWRMDPQSLSFKTFHLSDPI